MISRDLFSGLPAQTQIPLQIVLAVVASLCAWIAFDTHYATNWLARLGPTWMPLREASISMAKKPGWIWFYRIDSAVVFAGVGFILISHWLLR